MLLGLIVMIKGWGVSAPIPDLGGDLFSVLSWSASLPILIQDFIYCDVSIVLFFFSIKKI